MIPRNKEVGTVFHQCPAQDVYKRQVLGPRSTNELKLQHLYTLEKSMPGSELPADNIQMCIRDRFQRVDGTARILREGARDGHTL